MTYILFNKLQTEREARKQYFCATMGVVSPVEVHHPDCIEYISYLPTRQSFLFLCGHNCEISRFLWLQYPDYHPDVTVITSCTWPGFQTQLSRLQAVYFSKTDQFGLTCPRNGHSFGFAFDITDSELNFFNDPGGDLLRRIQHSYWKVA